MCFFFVYYFTLACVYISVMFFFFRAAAACSRLLVGQINDHMPRTHGEGYVHISQFDYVYEKSMPLPGLSDALIHESQLPKYEAIAQNICQELVDDGCTMQLGIGAIPRNISTNLRNHRTLGVHTEMFGDELMELFDIGVITNAQKIEHPGKTVASFVLGSQRVYDYVNDNPRVFLCETSYVNDPAMIARNPKVCAINSAIEIDLTGQVVADSIGLNSYSGVGGMSMN